MSQMNFSKVLGEWEGYKVVQAERFEAGEKGRRAAVWIELGRRKAAQMRCGRCEQTVKSVHEYTERWIRDLPILDADTSLLVPIRRVDCPRCGPKMEKINWLERYGRVTRRLAESVARMCEVMAIGHVAKHFHLGWGVVKRIHKLYLERTLGPVDLSGVAVIVMDEFALRKGQRYATVIAEPYTRRVLWVGKGHGREDIRPFFEALGPEGRRRLQAVGMDMNGAYEKEVRAQCPQAQIVYDLFHLIAKYAREVIDPVRVAEAKRVDDEQPTRQAIKGSRWLLLRNRENLPFPEDRVRLQELLAANKPLMKVYVLREDLKHLWDFKYPAAAKRFWRGWYRRAIHSRVEPLKKFARRLKPYLQGILAHCRWPIHTSFIEGVNNKIKVLKRMAYRFRDQEYFFLRIRSAFPGIR